MTSESDQSQLGPGYGMTAFEQLLLAIIEANPSDSTETPKQRLNSAMKALVGHRSTPNPMPTDPDELALRFMASEMHKDEARVNMHKFRTRNDPNADPPPKTRSYKVLAEQAAAAFFEVADEQVRLSIVNRLREKLGGSYYRKQRKRLTVNHERTYKYRSVEHDYVTETLEQQTLERICAELEKIGIKSKV